MEAVFWSTEIVFFNESFILAGGNGFWFFQSFFLLVDTILEIKCRPIFTEKHYSCSLKPFSWIFADIPAGGSSFFRLMETEFQTVYFYSQLFFLLLEALLKLGVNQLSSIFSVPDSGGSFSG